MYELSVHPSQNLGMVQDKLWNPHSRTDVAHATEANQITLCTQDGLSRREPLLQPTPSCTYNGKVTVRLLAIAQSA